MVATAALLCALPVIGVEPAAQAAASDTRPESSEGRQALAEAKASGKRIEVLSERSEKATVYANPDGFTFTLEESAVPVRAPSSNGGWQPADAALKLRSDGQVVPKAAAVKMEFSGGGGKAPLAQISDQGRSLSLAWPGKLPTPELDGESALYRDVIDGVDLKVTASTEGFRHVLVVRTPEAAASGELKKIDYSLKTNGLDIVEGKANNLTALDDDGNRVFRAPPARMWDSAGADETVSSPLSSRSSAALEGAASARSAEAASPGVEPSPGDTVKPMDVQVGDGALTVVPDADMLTRTEESAFPLYIDPTVTWSESERTLLRSDGYESYGWGNGSDGWGKGAGKCGTWNGYYCGPGYVQRLFFEFSPASLKGKKVLDATFRVTEPWAFQCSPRWVDLVRTKDNISSSTTWASRPMGWDLMGDRYVSAGRGSLCDPDSPDAPIEFNDNPDESNENLTPTVRDFAEGKFSRLTLMIKAHDETDTSAWKRFKNDAVLSVDFVGLPAKPTGIGLVTGSGVVCETGESDPAVVSDPTPSLTAKSQTASGGEKSAQLRVYFDIDHKNGDGTWTDTTAGNGDLRPSSGYVGNGVKLTMSWSALTEGTLYRYRAWVRSYYNNGGSYLSGPSNASTTGWCYFKVDPSAPKAPQIAISSPYSECTTNACVAAGAPGVKGTFSFAPAAGDTNNVAYQYKLSSEEAWKSAGNGTTASTAITPERSGTHSVYVRAKDDVGRWGAQNTADFLVAAGDGPVGRWHFDEDAGPATDAATADGADDATLAGGAVRDDRGRRGLITHDTEGQELESSITDKGLSLDGSTGHAATVAPVLETRSAYTLSAWVRLEDDEGYATVLSQPGEGGNPFSFWYSDKYKTWYFGVLKEDASEYYGRPAVYPAATGVWTHLAGTYDPATEKLNFYVDGRLQVGAVNTAGSRSSDGPLQFGRNAAGSGYAQYFPGSIDEVAVWQRVLTRQEIAQEAQLLTSEHFAAAELVADFSPARGSGTTVPDTTSGYGKSLTLTSGASLDGDAIVLDGVDDAATTSGPLVYDHAAFTVTTLAELDGAALVEQDIGYTGQVLGQRTDDGSAWGLWYELTGKSTELDEETLEEIDVPVGKWHFGRLSSDGAFSSVVSDEAAALDSPVRLTGVYDSLTRTISLHLGYNQNGDSKIYTVEIGSGDFAIGKGLTGGTWKHFLPARISEVRLWAGAMASSEQIKARVGD
ncbi:MULTISPECIES: LamG domain-containing protein [Streptomyces]|uniref:LamG domain protein jellyroll fold domain protein n=2 Tax=Streptomyces TaxID=1883 RepID=A0A3R7HZX8_9ACTN|nr:MULTISPECIES: LamG domain-containing protein [Streptomyces]KNE83776.1 LamG domain protein jellyroll fold domain protein [Streptomyces fradiae]OFA51160.1 LamG domain protein jellyroll fold domain protein [Streptomyces fradiae]PQM20342.1 LamG domain protein jellyroll fold domain protein [Streptomyces xinghaiensis]RKM94111.1 LamG domain protein jellyroll fold domain protein [Streptomyces xinghaiensis]RNC69544.1 LamG domain protein jellyroll fold domain protein [Streptomyces xinghaiensis]